jgi:NitT/TauT family transport system substrate-binding protein
LTRRRLVSAFGGGAVWLAGATVALTAGCSLASVAPQQPLKLTVGVGSAGAPPVPNSVLWLASDTGFYQREGLEVDLVELPSTPSVIAAMQGGQVDVGNIGTEDVLRLASSHTLDLKAIHSPDGRLYFLIAGRDSLADVTALAGRSFSIARVGSVDDTMSRLVLQAHGVDPEQINFVGQGDPTIRAQALASGRVDATTMSVGTWASIQKAPGVKVLVDAEAYYQAAPIVVKVDAVLTSVLTRKEEAVKRFTTAIVKASRQFAADQNAWIDAMAARRPDLDRDDLGALWPTFRDGWAVNGQLNLRDYARTADLLYASTAFQDVTNHLSVQQWTDSRILDGVLQITGVQSSSDDPVRQVS